MLTSRADLFRKMVTLACWLLWKSRRLFGHFIATGYFIGADLLTKPLSVNIDPFAYLLSLISFLIRFHTAGKGTRLAPLPGSENNNKPGVKLPATYGTGAPISILEGVVQQVREIWPNAGQHIIQYISCLLYLAFMNSHVFYKSNLPWLLLDLCVCMRDRWASTLRAEKAACRCFGAIKCSFLRLLLRTPHSTTPTFSAPWALCQTRRLGPRKGSTSTDSLRWAPAASLPKWRRSTTPPPHGCWSHWKEA